MAAGTYQPLYSGPGTFFATVIAYHDDKRIDTVQHKIIIHPIPTTYLGPDQTICSGSSATFDAGVCAGCGYEWKNVGTGLIVGSNQTFTTGIAGVYCVKVTNGYGCSGRDTVQLFTTAVPQVVPASFSKTICTGESTSMSLASSVLNTMFHWTASVISGTVTGAFADSGTVINQILLNPGAIPGVVNYHIIPKVGSCVGNAVDYQVTVNLGNPVSITITTPTTTVCAGTSVTFTATPAYPGSTPVYQWKMNGLDVGTNSDTYSYVPLNGDVVSCALTSSLTTCVSNNPATSNSIVMVVNPNNPVSVSISTPLTTVCTGTSVTFTASPGNPGLLPVYQWKVNGVNVGPNSDTYSYIPLNGDVASCVLTSSLTTCVSNNPATSNSITITVNSLMAVSLSIAAVLNPVCSGSPVTINANPINPGGSPVYQWWVNGVNTGTNSNLFTYIPSNNDQVWCVLTSNEPCAINNPASSIP